MLPRRSMAPLAPVPDPPVEEAPSDAAEPAAIEPPASLPEPPRLLPLATFRRRPRRRAERARPTTTPRPARSAPPPDGRLAAAMGQTIGTLQAQVDQQHRVLEEKDRQILELHALLREAMRRPVPLLMPPAHEATAARPWWRRWLGRS
ncbi:MAG: hypothetical protein NTZ05_05320 [Chloroflexi bacterium]|nr:hypothetical protein [Chloroflexota bacterium]